MNTLETYLERFAKLRSDTNRKNWPITTYRRAPHKPLLLLAVMDSIAERTISTNLIEITPDLGELFTLYWSRVIPPDQHGNLALPFFHLKRDGFWHLIPQPGKEAVVEAISQIRYIGQLRELVIGARLDEELFQLLQDEQSRERLRALVIETCFAPELRPGLLEQGIINLEAYSYSENLLKQAKKQKGFEFDLVEQAPRLAARDQGFRRAVVTAYDHRCAICGMRMMTADGHTVVDAAHIKPWSISFNDNPRNGMALCKLCHWIFDEGMVSVSDKYVVITSRQLSANRNIPGLVVTLGGRNIITPKEKSFWPDVDALNWHKQKVFRSR